MGKPGSKEREFGWHHEEEKGFWDLRAGFKREEGPKDQRLPQDAFTNFLSQDLLKITIVLVSCMSHQILAPNGL